MTPTCSNCPFYFPLKRECRYDPPKVQLYAPMQPNPLTPRLEPIGPEQPTSYFPPQHPESWCGRHPGRRDGQQVVEPEPLPAPVIDLIKGITKS